MHKELYPLGVRRDGSYYTRIEWASHTESDPCFWVGNVIDDDTQRNGGTWGANTMGPADVVLSFFGESQTISRIEIYKNVGEDISVLEELAKIINIYVSQTDEPRELKNERQTANDVPWEKILTHTTEKTEGWESIILDSPVEAKYIRFELFENHGTPPDVPWIEISEIKLYP
ncbi:MAG: hypothetical protein IJP03_03065 [Christensenellaceae bacterium]|nr:hypothetical protein [Christensenellaceae bacterium]